MPATIAPPASNGFAAAIPTVPIMRLSVDQYHEMMRTGMVRSRKLNNYMPWQMYGKQTDEDLKAIFAYLRTIPGVAHRVDNSQPPTLCPRCGQNHGAGNQNKPVESS